MMYSKTERFDYILKELEQEGKLVVTQIAESLQVTPETIRRDFAELEQQHLLTRVHGGAIHYKNVRNEPAFIRKLQMQKEEKRCIAKVAATRISSGDTIAVDIGTTTVHIAEFVFGVDNITVVTNSIAAAVQFNLAIEERRMTGKVILLGGATNPSQSSISGVLTLEMLSNMSFDKAFLSCGGLYNGLIYDYDLDESLISKKMLLQSHLSYLLADATKINEKSFYQIGMIENCTEILCDAACPDTWQVYKGQWTVCKEGGEQV